MLWTYSYTRKVDNIQDQSIQDWSRARPFHPPHYLENLATIRISSQACYWSSQFTITLLTPFSPFFCLIFGRRSHSYLLPIVTLLEGLWLWNLLLIFGQRSHSYLLWSLPYWKNFGFELCSWFLDNALTLTYFRLAPYPLNFGFVTSSTIFAVVVNWRFNW